MVLGGFFNYFVFGFLLDPGTCSNPLKLRAPTLAKSERPNNEKEGWTLSAIFAFILRRLSLW